MTITIPAGSTVKLVAQYVDAAGNPTSPPPGAGQITWSDADQTVMTLDATIGESVSVTAAGDVGATANLSVTDGSMTSAPITVSVVAGPAVALEIRAA